MKFIFDKLFNDLIYILIGILLGNLLLVGHPPFNRLRGDIFLLYLIFFNPILFISIVWITKKLKSINFGIILLLSAFAGYISSLTSYIVSISFHENYVNYLAVMIEKYGIAVSISLILSIPLWLFGWFIGIVSILVLNLFRWLILKKIQR